MLVENQHKELIMNCGQVRTYVEMKDQQEGSTILEVNILMICL